MLLHHEVEVEFPNGEPTENHVATLLEFGRINGEKSYTAMALTVGIPAAIGALVHVLCFLDFTVKKASKLLGQKSH